MYAFGASKVAELSDPTIACQELVEAPMRNHQGPVIILIDALDEADPPEQLLPDFDGKGVKACGNKALGLLHRHFARLGKNVRFIITTRPDAICNQVQPVLRRTFEESIIFVQPQDLRQDFGMDDGGHNAGGVLVYNTVAKECGVPGMPSSQDAPASLEDVYRAYAYVFDRDLGRLGAEMKRSVVTLTHVLLAAQEPLSQSVLYEMGLGDALENLPGWGSLFFVNEHHVYMIHKSLADWLVRAGHEIIDKLVAHIPNGHLELGRHLRKSTALPSDYCLRYMVFHLTTSQGAEAISLLDSALADGHFMIRVAKARYLGQVVGSLGSMSAEAHSVSSLDTMRWLQLAMHQLEADPTMRSLVRTVLQLCPSSSWTTFRSSVLEVQAGYYDEKVLGRRGQRWGAEWATLRVRFDVYATRSIVGLVVRANWRTPRIFLLITDRKRMVVRQCPWKRKTSQSIREIYTQNIDELLGF